ncbi:MAG: hypothetical protein J6L69_10090 [Lachnospiraceae bacterium]|nr:hypothetical protein [Lachnospiraceae bacterium]
MKKVIALLLTIAMLCSITACSEEEVKSENNKETKQTIEASNDNKETTSKKDKESESTKVVADVETSVNEKDTTVNTENETTSKVDATSDATESDTKTPTIQPTTSVKPGATEQTTATQHTEQITTETATECNHNWAKKCGNYAYDEPIPVTISGEVPVYWDWGIRECSCDICKASPYYVEVTVATLAYEGIRQDSDFYENVMFDGYTILDNEVGQFKTINKNTKTLKGVDIKGLEAFYELMDYESNGYSYEEFIYGLSSDGTFQERVAYTCGIDNVQTVFASNNSTTITIETENSTYHIVYDYCTKCGLNECLGRDQAEALPGAIKYDCVAYDDGMFGKCICEDWEGYLN